jgi:hypothetical protein
MPITIHAFFTLEFRDGNNTYDEPHVTEVTTDHVLSEKELDGLVFEQHVRDQFGEDSSVDENRIVWETMDVRCVELKVVRLISKQDYDILAKYIPNSKTNSKIFSKEVSA